ncbi:MAG TPA: glutamate synthase subunit beta [Solirubrobacteraceae bacterium]|nr:glutamate synthase subunit beta [Solirubrobacteraceae bacterium]
MGQLGGFLRITRAPTPQRDPRTRIADHREVYELLPEPLAREQGARCMDCGVPFCHDGCPLGNLIPDWNDLVYRDEWRAAIERLHATNDFPEFTGRICPAPCEPACVLAINDDPVSIKQIELAIVERAWTEGWIHPRPPAVRSGRRVAVVGSGPAGLAAAAQLNRAGHEVTVYERDEAPGGLLRFGVPDFKLEKWVIERRTALLEAEGVVLRCGEDPGALDGERLLAHHDGLVVAIGSRVPRDLPVPGRELGGVHFAMDYLYQRNRGVAAAQGRPAPPPPAPEDAISAAGRDVVVVGGGDTAMDCIANAHREWPRSVTLLDIYPAPAGPAYRDIVPWPAAPKRLPSTYALDEGGDRMATRTATELIGVDGHVRAVRGAEVGPAPAFEPLPGSEFELPADLVLVAIGFAHPEHDGLVGQLGLELDARGNVRAPAFAASRPGVFAAGDARRGQSLVVTAIAEGRRCARAVDRFLATA